MANYRYKGVVDQYIAANDESSRYLIKTKGIKPLICLGLNPSTANRTQSDLTIRRVETYAEKNGYDSIAMINLYPLRSTDPKMLPDIKDDLIYEKNLSIIKEVINLFSDAKILLAMGGDVDTRTYLSEALKELIKFGNMKNVKWVSTGLTKDGFPRHPSRGSYRDIVDYNPKNLL